MNFIIKFWWVSEFSVSEPKFWTETINKGFFEIIHKLENSKSKKENFCLYYYRLVYWSDPSPFDKMFYGRLFTFSLLFTLLIVKR